jgi:SulP family sulfate permease
MVYRIDGAFFFGAAAMAGRVLERVVAGRRALVVDLSGAPMIDSTAAHTIEGMVHKARRLGMQVMLTGTTHDQRVLLFAQGLKPPLVAYESTLAAGLRKMRHKLDQPRAEVVDRSPHRA